MQNAGGRVQGWQVEEKASVVGRLVILTEQISEDCIEGLLCSSDGKEFASNAGDLGSIAGSGRSLGEGNDCVCVSHSVMSDSLQCPGL